MEDDPGEYGAIRVDMIGSNSLHEIKNQHSYTHIGLQIGETALTPIKMDTGYLPSVQEDFSDSPEGLWYLQRLLELSARN